MTCPTRHIGKAIKAAGLLSLLILTACATGSADRQVTIVTATGNGQEFPGANCSVLTDNRSWNVTTPATLDIPTSGDLRIVCSKAGYRTSELRLPPIGQSGSSMGIGMGGGSGNVGMGLGFSLPINTGGGSYPPRILITMSPS